jgi:hypothetical protein
MDVETSCPTRSIETLQRVRGLQCQHGSREESGEQDDGQRSHTDGVGLPHHVGEVQRFPEEIRDRLTAEQNVVLNCLDFLLGEIRGRDEFHAASRIARTKPRSGQHNYNKGPETEPFAWRVSIFLANTCVCGSLAAVSWHEP